eukprot:5053372-Amphidinium_carterae.2
MIACGLAVVISCLVDERQTLHNTRKSQDVIRYAYWSSRGQRKSRDAIAKSHRSTDDSGDDKKRTEHMKNEVDNAKPNLFAHANFLKL